MGVDPTTTIPPVVIGAPEVTVEKVQGMSKRKVYL